MEGNLEQMQNITGKIKELEIDKTLSKKGKCAESKAVGEALATKVSITDIVDDLTSVAEDKPLSANQGRVLKKQIDDVDPHYAENMIYGDSNVKDALDNVQGAIDELKGTIGYTSKNLIPYPFYETTKTYGKVTYTDNGDGTITTTGTLSEDTSFCCHQRTIKPFTLKKGTYILSGCPKGGAMDKHQLFLMTDNNGSVKTIARDYGEGAIFTLEEDTKLGLNINIASGVNVDGLVFEPMIRPASIEDDTYKPYVPSVKSLICDVEPIQKTVLVSCTTDFVEAYKYTATKKCIVNLSATAFYSNSVPKMVGIIKNNNIELAYNGYTNKYDIHGLNCSAFAVLEKNETIAVSVKYNANANNNVYLSGYIQYLE